MPYDRALWDGSDPTYAPGAGWSGRWCYWKPTPKFRKLGYPIKSVRLPGEKDDGRDLERAREARRLTREMLAHFNADKPAVEVGTWEWLIHRYLTDKHSPLNRVKGNTRENYVWCVTRWRNSIGHYRLAETTHDLICDIEAGMNEKGRSVAYIHRMFNRLRAIAKYGKVLRDPAAIEVCEILSEMRFRTPPRRSVAPTREQVRAIVDEADARGMFAFATGILIQWVYALRAVDVRGQWLPCEPGTGGIIRELGRNKRQQDKPRQWVRWQDGLTWDMVAPDLSAFEKVISKTERSLPEPIRFDLEIATEIQNRLRILANRGRIGPVITSEKNGQPYTKYSWGKAFARIRDDLGLPEMWMMDSRAGAISEASRMGADIYILSQAAQHKDTRTTDRYVRTRSESVAKVVQLRSGR